MHGMRVKSHRRPFLKTSHHDYATKRYFSYQPPARLVPVERKPETATVEGARAPEAKLKAKATARAVARPKAKAKVSAARPVKRTRTAKR